MQEVYNTNYKFTQRLVHIQYRFILFYLIYIFLGGFFALYYKDIERIIKKNYKKAITFFILSTLALLASYVLEVYTFHLPIDFASAFDQPLIITYSLALIIVIFKLSIDLSKNKIKLVKKINKQIVKFFFIVSEAAFGIYLMHPIILNFVSSNIIYPIYRYNINTPLIGFFSVFIGWILTVLIVLAIVLIIIQIPYLNILVGKYSKYERKQNKKTPMLDTQL